MRLRTQFIITMLLFCIILVVIATSAIVTNQRVEEADQQARIAGSIAQGAGELSYLANDYLMYREDQQLKRWQSRFASFSKQVAELRADEPDHQALVRNIQKSQERLKEVFDSVVSAQGRPSQKQEAALAPAFLQVSWSRMAIQSQGLVSDASRLSQLLHQQMDDLTNTRTILMYVMVGLFGLLLLASYMLTYRRILKSIATLRAGTAVIGSGNLDFIIEERKNDEIGELSYAFNRMTTDLKAVTASKADLEREIVERRRAEEELREQREWLRVTLTSIGDAVMTTDASGRITFLNPVAEALTGWQAHEAMGQSIQSVFQIINERSREPAENIIQRVLQQGSVVTLANSTVLISREGKAIPIEDSAAPIMDREGAISGVVLVFHDVSEKRLAEKALRESEKRYRTLFESMSEGFALHEIICDATGRPSDYRFLQVNPAFERLTGLKAADLVGHTLYEVLPQSESIWVERYGAVALTGEAAHFDQWSEDLGRHYEVSAFQSGRGRFGVVFVDVTKRKQAEAALKKARDELEQRVEERTKELHEAYRKLVEQTTERERMEEHLRQAQKMEAVGTLAGGIAHDFNNVLAAIIGFTELTIDDAPAGSLMRRNMQYVLQASIRGRDLVRQILTFSRKSDTKRARLHLTPVVGETVRLLRASLPTTIAMDLQTDATADEVLVESTDISQILMNLGANAAYAMREKGGQLTITLTDSAVSPDSQPPHPDLTPGAYVVLSVQDTGCGMDAETKNRIFEPFFTTKERGQGTGLGLALVHGIVTSLGGAITVSSAVGKGTAFSIFLPKATREQQTEPEMAKELRGGRERILFVDDEKLLVETAKAMLSRLGYEVVAVTDASEALRIFSEEPERFHLVITDYTMPNVTGADLARDLMRIRPDVPIILCTGYTDMISREEAQALGIREFAMKPFSRQEIAEMIRRVLDRSQID